MTHSQDAEWRASVAEWCGAGAGYAALVVALSWPLATRLGTALVDPLGLGRTGALWGRVDLDLLVWILGWTAHAAVTQPLDFFQANIFHPAANSLASSEHLVGLLPLSAPIFLASGNAVLTYNLTLLAILWIACLCTFALVRHWTRSAPAAFVAGAAFALGPEVTLSFTRLHQSAVHLFPLVLLLAWRAAAKPAAATLVALAVATALQLVSGVYVAFELLVLIAAFTPSILLEGRARGHSGLAPLAAIAVGVLALLPVALPYLSVRAAGGLPDLASSLVLAAQAAPSAGQLAQRLRGDLPLPILLLSLVGALFFRGAPWHLRMGLIAAAGAGFLLALGPTLPLVPGTSVPGLYEILMRAIPGFAVMRAPARFLVLTTLSLSLLAACGTVVLLDLARQTAGVRAARVGSVTIVLAALLLVPARAYRWPLPLSSDPLSGVSVGAHRWLRHHAEPGPVLDLPANASDVDGRTLLSTGRAMLGSTLHWFPLLNGYSGYPPPSHRLLMTLAQRLPDRRALQDLCALAAPRWLVVHFGLMPGEEGVWREALPGLPVAEVARVGRDAIYRVDCPAPEGNSSSAERTASGSDRTTGGASLTPLEPSARRADVTPELPAELVAGKLVWIWSRVANRGDAGWPGLTAERDGVLQIQARWREPETGRVILVGEPSLLARDLPPGKSMRAQVGTLVPPAGDYTLEIGLTQKGVGWFADQGGGGLWRGTVRVAPDQI